MFNKGTAVRYSAGGAIIIIKGMGVLENVHQGTRRAMNKIETVLAETILDHIALTLANVDEEVKGKINATIVSAGPGSAEIVYSVNREAATRTNIAIPTGGGKFIQAKEHPSADSFIAGKMHKSVNFVSEMVINRASQRVQEYLREAYNYYGVRIIGGRYRAPVGGIYVGGREYGGGQVIPSPQDR